MSDTDKSPLHDVVYLTEQEKKHLFDKSCDVMAGYLAGVPGASNRFGSAFDEIYNNLKKQYVKKCK